MFRKARIPTIRAARPFWSAGRRVRATSRSSGRRTISCSARTSRRSRPGADRAPSRTASTSSSSPVQGVDNGSSSATAIAELQKALQLYSATPSNRSLAQAPSKLPGRSCRTLNDGTDAIQSFRTQTDKQINSAVDELNTLLGQFKEVNDLVINGTTAGRDVSDALDRRDTILKQISSYVPITSMIRGHNDMVLTTKDGGTLFETVPRSVTLPANQRLRRRHHGQLGLYRRRPGQAVRPAATPKRRASIAGLLQLRDSVTTTMQSAARRSGARPDHHLPRDGSDRRRGPDAAGLFTWTGAPAIPAAGTLVERAGRSITINAALRLRRPAAIPSCLRDGGANGAAYVANTAGVASYSAQILTYADRMDTTMAFDTTAGAGSGVSLANYASNTVGWFEGVRKDAANGCDQQGSARVTLRRSPVERHRRQCRYGDVSSSRFGAFLSGIVTND